MLKRVLAGVACVCVALGVFVAYNGNTTARAEGNDDRQIYLVCDFMGSNEYPTAFCTMVIDWTNDKLYGTLYERDSYYGFTELTTNNYFTLTSGADLYEIYPTTIQKYDNEHIDFDTITPTCEITVNRNTSQSGFNQLITYSFKIDENNLMYYITYLYNSPNPYNSWEIEFTPYIIVNESGQESGDNGDFETGYNAGYNVGYDTGLADGADIDFTSPFEKVKDAVTEILHIELIKGGEIGDTGLHVKGIELGTFIWLGLGIVLFSLILKIIL